MKGKKITVISMNENHKLKYNNNRQRFSLTKQNNTLEKKKICHAKLSSLTNRKKATRK